jgi:hypothetical protein
VNGENLTNVKGNTDKTYSTMLKLISGALVGGTNYSEIYITSDIEEDDTSTTSDNWPSNTTKHHSNAKHRNIPTMQKSLRVKRTIKLCERIKIRRDTTVLRS